MGVVVTNGTFQWFFPLFFPFHRPPKSLVDKEGKRERELGGKNGGKKGRRKKREEGEVEQGKSALRARRLIDSQEVW